MIMQMKVKYLRYNIGERVSVTNPTTIAKWIQREIAVEVPEDALKKARGRPPHDKMQQDALQKG